LGSLVEANLAGMMAVMVRRDNECVNYMVKNSVRMTTYYDN